MATANFFAPGFDDQVEQQNIERQRKMADLLRQQSVEPMPSGSMVGGHFVAPSFTQGLAKLLQGYNAGQMGQEADDKQKALAEAVRGRNAEEFGKFTGMLTGQPARELQPLTPNDDEGNVNPAVNIAAQAPDLGGAYKYAATAHNPALQQFGVSGALTQAQEQAKMAQAEALRTRYAQILAAPEMTAQKALVLGVPEANVKAYYEAPLLGKEDIKASEGTLYGGKTGKIVSTIANPNKPFNADGTPNAAYQEYELLKAKKGASNVNNTVSVAGPENKYNQSIGEGLAKEGLALVDAAKAAPAVVDNARMIKSALDKGAITGSGADTRLAVQKAAETLGIVEPGKAATTQSLMSGLSKLTLSGIKTSGLGGGNGFTDKDREFLNAAIGGQITDTPENLRRVADLSERVATATHAKGSKVLERWKTNPSLAGVAQDTVLDPIQATAIAPASAATRPPLSSFKR